VLPVPKVLQELKEQLDLLDLLVLPVHKVPAVLLDHKALAVQLVLRVQLDSLDLVVLKEQLDLLDL
jgi:hypothetical protein